jgi:peptidoglycan/xylan/chitin deacetylase (PgdA/CDA1 family)
MSSRPLTILMYHRVLAEHDPLQPDELTAADFASQVAVLARLFRVLPLDEAIDRLYAGTLPSRAVAITFDDGYRDNHAVALPILARHACPATFFIATGYLDGGCMWNDTVREALRACGAPTLDLRALGLGEHALGSDAAKLAAAGKIICELKYAEHEQRERTVREIAARAGWQPREPLMMRRHEIRDLLAHGMQIGAHTVTHPILARSSDAAARAEIEASCAEIRSLCADRPLLFAYPNGFPGRDFRPEHAAMVAAAGVRAAVTTQFGVCRASSGPFMLPRFSPWRMSAWRFAWNVASLRWQTHPTQPVPAYGPGEAATS